MEENTDIMSLSGVVLSFIGVPPVTARYRSWRDVNMMVNAIHA